MPWPKNGTTACAASPSSVMFSRDHGEQRTGGNFAREMMHGRMPVVAERDVAKGDLRRHAHLIASQTMPHSAALTATAAASRVATVMRRIDHGAACAGCGVAGSWLWRLWP